MYSGGTVCDDYFNNKTADWICVMMGYESLLRWESGKKYSWQDYYPTKLDDVKCTGIIVPQCKYITDHDCQHTEDVWLHCNLRKQRGNLTSFYLLDKNAKYTQSGIGLLMYRGETICDDGFNATTANWICQSMGYDNAANWAHDRLFPLQDDLAIKVDNLVCRNGGIYSDVLPACSIVARSRVCAHLDDIWITCRAVDVQCPAGYKLKFNDYFCEPCPPGTYSPTPNTYYTCQPCPKSYK